MNGRKLARRLAAVALVGLAAWGAYRWYWHIPTPPAAEEPKFTPSKDALPPDEAFAELARKDIVAMFEAALTRYAREVKGFTATLAKRERLDGVLHDPELVKVAVAHDPLRIRMVWEQGARKDRVGKATVGALYDAGKNKDKTTVWRPDALLKTMTVGVKDSDARRAARYTITEGGFDKSMLRTLDAWKQARDRGGPPVEYLGRKPVEEAGGRECHVIRRGCPVPEVDSFALDEEPSKDAGKIKADGHSQVTVMIDAATWLQVGTELRRADGELTASYFFRDVVLNPTFPPDAFTVEALKRK